MGIKCNQTSQTQVIPVVSTELLVSLEFNKLSRSLPSWQLRINNPCPPKVDVLNETELENRKRHHPVESGEKGKKQREAEKSRLILCYWLAFTQSITRFLQKCFNQNSQFLYCIPIAFKWLPNWMPWLLILWLFHYRVHFWWRFTLATSDCFTRLWSVSMCIVLRLSQDHTSRTFLGTRLKVTQVIHNGSLCLTVCSVWIQFVWRLIII